MSKTKKTDQQIVEQVSKAPCSVELTRDAKGNPKWTIKVYCEAEDIDEAKDEVLRIDKEIANELKG